MNDIQGASVKGRELYHAIWQATKDNFFWRDRLSGWDAWEHRFDDSIVDQPTALSFAQEMVASLGEKFTHVQVETVCANRSDEPGSKTQERTDSQCFSRRLANIGYLCIWSFDAEGVAGQVAEAAEKFADCDGIILDLRGNGGGNIEEAVRAAETFLEEGFVATLERVKNGEEQKRISFLMPDGRGTLVTIGDGDEEMRGFARRAPVLAGKPTVILIDNGTGSAAEIFAAALLENPAQNCVAAGKTTRGKGIAQRVMHIAPGVVLTVTCGRFYSPSEHWFGDAGQTLAAGIEPKTVVHLESWPAGMDAATKLLQETFLKRK